MRLKKVLFFHFVFAALLAVFSCSSFERNANAAVGEYSWENWRKATGFEPANLDGVNLDSADAEYLRRAVGEKNLTFVIFATSFCSECRKELPKIFGLFEKIGVKRNRYRLFGLDEYFEEPSGYFANFYFDSTPTLFVLRDGKEIARVSFPRKNWIKTLIKEIKNAED